MATIKNYFRIDKYFLDTNFLIFYQLNDFIFSLGKFTESQSGTIEKSLKIIGSKSTTNFKSV